MKNLFILLSFIFLFNASYGQTVFHTGAYDDDDTSVFISNVRLDKYTDIGGAYVIATDGSGNVKLVSRASIAALLDTTSLSNRINLKEDAANKSTSTSLGASNTLYPSQNAVKTYVDDAIAALATVYIKNGGNTLGAAMTIGTLGANSLSFFTNGSSNTRYSISSAGVHTFTGNVGMGITPTSPLHIQGTTDIDVLKQKSTYAGAGSLSPRTAFENAAGNTVRIGIIDNAAVFAVQVASAERFRASANGANLGTFSATTEVQNLLSINGSLANAASNSTGLNLTILGASSSVGGYDMILGNTIDNETNSGGNRNLMRLQFNSTDVFSINKRGKITIASGANRSTGSATLVAGTVTVNNTTVTASSKIFFSPKTASGSAVGVQYNYTIVAGTSFTVTSIKSDLTTETNDASTFDYWIIN